MPLNGDNETEPSQSWTRFVAGCPNAKIPDSDTLYALPQKLIKAIAKRLPQLWSDPELDLEYALSNCSGGGFIRKQPFKRCLYRSYLLHREFDPPPEPNEPEDDVRSSSLPRLRRVPNATRKELRSPHLFDDEDKEFGRTPTEMKSYRKMIEAAVQEDDELRTAYAGWLVTNPRFQRDMAELRSYAPPSCELTGKMPLVFTSNNPTDDKYFKETGAWRPTSSPFDYRFNEDFQLICGRWCIQSLLTWDIPLPVECSPLFSPQSFGDVPQAYFGLTLFVPFTVLKLKGLEIRKRLEPLLRQANGPLSVWIGRSNGIGLERFRCIFRLFVFYELGLKRRYGNRLRRLQNQLDAAFAEYFFVGEELVRKYRQYLDRRLRAIERSGVLQDPHALMSVYSTKNAAEAEILRNALDGMGIKCEISGENQAGLAGIDNPEIQLLVWGGDFDRASNYLEQRRRKNS